MKPLLLLLVLGQSALAQCWNAGQHPRLLLNDCIADTWDSAHYPGGGSRGRLSAVAARVAAGHPANEDWKQFINQMTTSGNPKETDFFSGSTDGRLALANAYSFAALLYHKQGDDGTGSKFAQAAWNTIRAFGGVTYKVSEIQCTGSGSAGVCNITLSSPANPALTTATHATLYGVVSNDVLCGNGGSNPSGITISKVTDSTHLSFAIGNYQATAYGRSYTDPYMILVTDTNVANPTARNYNQYLSYMDELGNTGTSVSQWAYFYDWCYWWLQAQGADYVTYAQNQIIAGLWNISIKNRSSGFADNVRESDFHNHPAWAYSGMLEGATAIKNDRPEADGFLADATGEFWKGLSVNPASVFPNERYTYNLAVSNTVMAAGTFNWEGPGYWREAASNYVRAIEAYDTASGRAEAIWPTYFPDTKQAGLYKVYSKMPWGYFAALGDVDNTHDPQGRDNFGMVIINDRFPDSHFPLWINSNGYTWGSGNDGTSGMYLKLIFWPYVGQTIAKDFTDLPLAAKFGTDLFIRSGWGPNDTAFTYTGSIKGVWHRHDDAGHWLFGTKGMPIVLGQPYQSGVEPAYTDYTHKTVGANTYTLYDKNDCWVDTVNTCPNMKGFYFPFSNNGDQFTSNRRLRPEFPNDSGHYGIYRTWSGTVYSDKRVLPGFTDSVATVYGNVSPISQPAMAVHPAWEHISHDLTSAYTNKYSGTGDNFSPKTANAAGQFTQEIVHFQKSLGSRNPVVMFARIKAVSPAIKKAFNFHTAFAPTAVAHEGATTAGVAGDNSYNNTTVAAYDNANGGRMWITPLLPATPTMRVVGGNACTPITITQATLADPVTNPTVYYAPNHGLTAGEAISIATGAYPSTGGAFGVPGWGFDPFFGTTYTVGSVLDANHFTIAGGPGSGPTTLPIDSVVSSGAVTIVTYHQSGQYSPMSMKTGTVMNFSGATGVWAALNGNQTVTYVSDKSFSVPVNSSAFPAGGFNGVVVWPFSTAFLFGNGAPAGAVGNGKFYGQLYYQQDGPAHRKVWLWMPPGAWVLDTGGPFSYSDNFAGPTIYLHRTCIKAYWVDQYGPLVGGNAVGMSLWQPQLDSGNPNYDPSFRTVISSPATSGPADYFLTVLDGGSKTDNTPGATLISGTGVYGVDLPDTGGHYVAVFPTTPAAQGTITYTVTHTGQALHVITGLVPSATYRITNGGTFRVTASADSTGALSFSETGGGQFTVATEQ